MSIHNLPSYDLFWSEDPRLHVAPVANTYEELTKYVHLPNLEDELPRDHPDNDKLFKMRYILEETKWNFYRFHNSHKNLSGDEGMVGFKGRSGYKQ